MQVRSLPIKNPNPNPTTVIFCDALAYRYISARLGNPTTRYPLTSPEIGDFSANIQQSCSPGFPHSGGFGRNPHALRLKLRRSLRLWPRLVDTIIFVVKGCIIAIIPFVFSFVHFLVKGSALTVAVRPLLFRLRKLVVDPLVKDDGVVIAAFNSVSYLHYLISGRGY